MDQDKWKAERSPYSFRAPVFHGHALGEIARFIDVARLSAKLAGFRNR